MMIILLILQHDRCICCSLVYAIGCSASALVLLVVGVDNTGISHAKLIRTMLPTLLKPLNLQILGVVGAIFLLAFAIVVWKATRPLSPTP